MDEVKQGIILDGNRKEGLANVELIFVPSEEFCVDTIAEDISFQYRAVAFSVQNSTSPEVVSVSDSVEQRIRVTCAIDPLLISIKIQPEMAAAGRKEEEEETDSNSSTAMMMTTHVFDGNFSHPCSGYMYNATETDPASCHSAVIIVDGIQVQSDATHANHLILVSISAIHGYLSINTGYYSKIRRLVNGRIEMKRDIQFLANGEDITDILSYLHYQTSVEKDDVISLSIRYGRCGFESELTLITTFESDESKTNFNGNMEKQQQKEKEECYTTSQYNISIVV